MKPKNLQGLKLVHDDGDEKRKNGQQVRKIHRREEKRSLVGTRPEADGVLKDEVKDAHHIDALGQLAEVEAGVVEVLVGEVLLGGEDVVPGHGVRVLDVVVVVRLVVVQAELEEERDRGDENGDDGD